MHFDYAFFWKATQTALVLYLASEAWVSIYRSLPKPTTLVSMFAPAISRRRIFTAAAVVALITQIWK
jgi:hypothetical protein